MMLPHPRCIPLAALAGHFATALIGCKPRTSAVVECDVTPGSDRGGALQYPHPPEEATTAGRNAQAGCRLVRWVALYVSEVGRLPDSLAAVLDSSLRTDSVRPHRGGLTDQWGMAFVLQLEGQTFGIRSAGSDRTLHTSDDTVFRPRRS